MDKYKNHNSYEMGNKINSYFISYLYLIIGILLNKEYYSLTKYNK